MDLFTELQHLCTFSIVAPYLSPFFKCLEGVVHHQRVHLCWCSVFDRPTARISSSLVLYRVFRSGSFSLAKRQKLHGLRRKRRLLMVQNPIILHGNARIHTAAAITDLLRPVNGRFWNIHRTVLTRYESMILRSLRQSERTIARDPAQHNKWTYPCCQYGTLIKMDVLMV